MQSRHKLMQKTVAFIAVLVLIVMMLPTAAFAAGNGKGNSFGKDRTKQAHQANAARVKGEDDPEVLEVVETEVDSEEMSAWAIYVHERKIWAVKKGMSSGHANLLDKLLAMSQELPGKDETAATDRVALLTVKYGELFHDGTPFNVKTVIQAIKDARNAARVAAATLESIA